MYGTDRPSIDRACIELRKQCKEDNHYYDPTAPQRRPARRVGRAKPTVATSDPVVAPTPPREREDILADGLRGVLIGLGIAAVKGISKEDAAFYAKLKGFNSAELAEAISRLIARQQIQVEGGRFISPERTALEESFRRKRAELRRSSEWQQAALLDECAAAVGGQMPMPSFERLWPGISAAGTRANEVWRGEAWVAHHRAIADALRAPAFKMTLPSETTYRLLADEIRRRVLRRY